MENKILFLTAIKEELDYTFLEEHANVSYLYTGIGKVNSAIALMKYLSQLKNYNLDVINIGTCGSVKYEIGEIISISGCSEHGSSFVSENMELLDISYKVPFCKQKDFILSSDFFISSQTLSKKDFDNLKRTYGNFDMEVAALAKVCRSYNVTFSAFKVVSDNLTSKINEWEEILKRLAPKLKEIALSILTYEKENITFDEKRLKKE